MNIGDLLALAAPYGPVGLLCVWFVWREDKRDKRDDKREERREVMEKDRIDADKALAVSMTLLAERVNK